MYVCLLEKSSGSGQKITGSASPSFTQDDERETRAFFIQMIQGLKLSAPEVRTLSQAIKNGQINGCVRVSENYVCLFGTLARILSISLDDLMTIVESTSPEVDVKLVELWFWQICNPSKDTKSYQAQTAETNYYARRAVEWCQELFPH